MVTLFKILNSNPGALRTCQRIGPGSASVLLNYQLPAAGPLTPDDYDVRDGFAQRWGKTDGWTGKNIMLLRLGSGPLLINPQNF